MTWESLGSDGMDAHSCETPHVDERSNGQPHARWRAAYWGCLMKGSYHEGSYLGGAGVCDKSCLMHTEVRHTAAFTTTTAAE